MRAATVVQQLCKSCRACFLIYCMFYFTCDGSLSFTVWTVTTTYELRNVLQVTRARYVGRNSGPIFTVCGPKLTKLNAYAQERLQFAKLFSVRRFLVSFRRYSRSSSEVVQTVSQILMFWGRHFRGRGGGQVPKISDAVL